MPSFLILLGFAIASLTQKPFPGRERCANFEHPSKTGHSARITPCEVSTPSRYPPCGGKRPAHQFTNKWFANSQALPVLPLGLILRPTISRLWVLGPKHGDAPSVGYELLYGQVTRAQGLFSPRTINIHFSLEYIAQNLDVPTVVLQYP